MGRKLVIEWQENEETLKQKYLDEKDRQNRTRLQALWQLRQGKTIKETADVVGSHPRTIQDWIAWYREGGVANVLSHRHGGHGGQCSWLSHDQEEKLKEVASDGELSCVQDGVDWIKEKHDISYTYWGMRSVFRRLKFKKKVPRPYNPKVSVAAQESWKKKDLLTS